MSPAATVFRSSPTVTSAAPSTTTITSSAESVCRGSRQPGSTSSSDAPAAFAPTPPPSTEPLRQRAVRSPSSQASLRSVTARPYPLGARRHRRPSEPTLTKVWQGCASIPRMRDFLAATRDRVIVFDGSMGATLEQYDLSLEDDYKLPGRCHEALVLNRPDVIEQLHASMIEAGAEVVETDTFQGSRLKL